jgi:hypothetical protein
VILEQIFKRVREGRETERSYGKKLTLLRNLKDCLEQNELRGDSRSVWGQRGKGKEFIQGLPGHTDWYGGQANGSVDVI